MLRMFQPENLSKAVGEIFKALAPTQQPQPVLVAVTKQDESIRFNRQSPRRARYRRASIARRQVQMKSSWF